jgi:hypothetical protein
MKKYGQAIGITLIVAGALVYPALRLFQYISKKRQKDTTGEPEEAQHVKAFSPAYRGKHNPHHRSEHNGHPDHGIA